jgi:hypothetical protein
MEHDVAGLYISRPLYIYQKVRQASYSDITIGLSVKLMVYWWVSRPWKSRLVGWNHNFHVWCQPLKPKCYQYKLFIFLGECILFVLGIELGKGGWYLLDEQVKKKQSLILQLLQVLRILFKLKEGTANHTSKKLAYKEHRAFPLRVPCM